MVPYKSRRLTGSPDVADCQIEGRNFSAGGADYNRNRRLKAAARRYLKRADKEMVQQEIKADL
jgi:hypothetical protein